MFAKVVIIVFFRRVTTRRGDKEYVYLKLIENYREGGKVRQRVIANLGNIERLAPDKVEALIAGLSRLCPPGTALPSFKIDLPSVTERVSAEPLRRVWRRLGLDEALTRLEGDETPKVEEFCSLIEAAVITHVLHPEDTRPLSVRCAELDLPPLGSEEVPGIAFFKAFCHLAAIVPALERHILERLRERPEHPAVLFIHPIIGEFIGNECGITTAGTAYQIRPYRRPLPMALIVHPDGLPIGCRLVPGGLTPEHLSALRQQLHDTCGADAFILFEEDLFGAGVPAIPNSIVALAPERYARAPFTATDPWAGNGTIHQGRWIKTVEFEGQRYVLSHNVEPEAPSDQAVESSLTQAAQELDQLRAAVRQKKLAREKTIRQRVQDVLKRHGCEAFIEFDYEPAKSDLRYSRREEVIKKEKMLRRTRVLRTDLQGPTGTEIAAAYDACANLASGFRVVQDMTRLPVVYPYADHQHTEAFIQGQLAVYALAGLLQLAAVRDRN